MSFFYRDKLSDDLVSWDQLIHDINSVTTYNPYCYSISYYAVFRQIVTSLVLDRKIVLLDSDFSPQEVTDLIGTAEVDQHASRLAASITTIRSKDALVQLVCENAKQWSMTLFTSGTTGQPKRVSHSFESICRFVRQSERHQENVWGYAYNPTHMAGVQVFFQALLNGNPIVRLFGLNPSDILAEVQQHQITNISATPTFYRLLLPTTESRPSVTRITSGGERFDDATTNQLRDLFPNAKLTNVYASTEAGTLLASDGEWFSIKPSIADLVRIEDNELLIHRSLLGTTESNVGEWYATGDLVERSPVNQDRFRFVSRATEMINVGGYKVNPSEVEQSLREMPEIRDVRVFAKRNSVLGSIVCCEVVRSVESLEEAAIRAFLQPRLQEFKIPRMIRFVDQIETTRSGKVKRANP